jgi:hypothetical protein
MKISPPGEAYVLRSQNSTRPLPNTARQPGPDLAATEKGIDAPSLILIRVLVNRRSRQLEGTVLRRNKWRRGGPPGRAGYPPITGCAARPGKVR